MKDVEGEKLPCVNMLCAHVGVVKSMAFHANTKVINIPGDVWKVNFSKFVGLIRR